MRHEVIVKAEIQANTDVGIIASVFKEKREIHTSYRLYLTVVDYKGSTKLYVGDRLAYTEVFSILEQCSFFNISKHENVLREVQEFGR